MKTNTKKITALSENFNSLQLLRNKIRDFSVQNVKWGGYWDGLKYQNFSFYSSYDTLNEIKEFCKDADMNILFTPENF